MTNFDLLTLLLLGAVISFFLTRHKAHNWQLEQNGAKLHSLPSYYGYMGALWSVVPALLVFMIWSLLQDYIIQLLLISNYSELSALPKEQLGLVFDEIEYIVKYNTQHSANPIYLAIAEDYIAYQHSAFVLKIIIAVAIAILGFLLTFVSINPKTKSRNYVEKFILAILFVCALIAIFTTAGIIFSMLFESIDFFTQVPILDFLFGTHWSPQIAIREDQYSSSGAFGAVPIFFGTIFISFIAMLIAGPLGLISAIYLAEYANKKMRAAIKPILEILAGIPTVVYGFFAALTIGPLMRDVGNWLKSIGANLDIPLFANMVVSTESVLAAGLVMGMMIIPFVLSLSDDVISAVPDTMRNGSTAMGATKSETVFKVIVPAALPGIVGGFLLAISRAVGETMIVLMAAGVAANLTANPFDSVTTVTTQIVVLLTGDQEFDNAKTLAAFALGLGLFVTTLLLNVLALHVVKKYTEQYE